MPTFTAKLLALGLTTALGGAGAFLAGPTSRGLLEPPAPPTSFTVGQGPTAALEADPALAPILQRVDPATLANPEVSAALRDPRVRALLADRQVQAAVADIDPAVLGRPGVLASIRSGELDPRLASDPVVMANLPAITRAWPVVQAAAARLDAARASAPAPSGAAPSEAELDAEASADPASRLEVTADLPEQGQAGGSSAGSSSAGGSSAGGSSAAEMPPPGRARGHARRDAAHAARDARHAARDARHATRDARHAARRQVLGDRPEPGEAPRGLTAGQRAQLRAIDAHARAAVRGAASLAVELGRGEG